MENNAARRSTHRPGFFGIRLMVLCFGCFSFFGCSYSYSILKPAEEKYDLQLVIDDRLVQDTENGKLFVESLRNAFSGSFRSVVVSGGTASPKPGDVVLVPRKISTRTWEENVPNVRNSCYNRHYAEAVVDLSVVKPSEKQEHTASAQACTSIFLPAEYVVTWPINMASWGANFALTLGTLGYYEKTLIKSSYEKAVQTSVTAAAIEFHNRFVSSLEKNRPL